MPLTLPQILYTQSTFGDLSSVDALISTASRFVYSLGGHLSPRSPSNPPSRRSWHCRNLFWICYNIDRKVCLRTGRPPCINDNCCDLSLPADYIAALKTEIPPSPGYTEPIFLSDIRLSLIDSKVFLELYAAPAAGKSDAELLRTIRSLDTMVEEWKVVALSGEQGSVQSEGFDPQTAIFRMHYFYSIATIHQATTGCSAWVHDQGRTMEGVSSSLMISVDASRQLLRLMSGTPAVLLADGFWSVSSIPFHLHLADTAITSQRIHVCTYQSAHILSTGSLSSFSSPRASSSSATC